MTRKRFIKLCMAVGVSRNRAREEAGLVQQHNMTAAVKNKTAGEREWAALMRYLAGDHLVSVDPIPRIRNTSYREHWDRAGE